MDDLITTDEIQISRSPAEFIQWFEEYLEKTRTDRRFKKEIILREGTAKVVYEEVLPLYRMLQVFEEEWSDLRFKNVIGGQSFDVEVTGDDQPNFRYVEITVADVSHEEHLRMQYFLTNGSVPGIGKVFFRGTKRKGHRIKVSNDARLHREVKKEKRDGIEKAIERKSRKDYPEGTVLLVYFDDYVAFAHEDDESEMENFIESLSDDWEAKFIEVFVVGASGKRGWRKPRANQ